MLAFFACFFGSLGVFFFFCAFVSIYGEKDDVFFFTAAVDPVDGGLRTHVSKLI
jgi:hypothetical protein